MAVDGHGRAMTIPDYIVFGILIALALSAGAMLYMRETIVASILKSRLHLWQLQCDLHDTALRSRETISQSQDLIAKVDEALAHNLFLVPPRY